jgi:hypothetical protein
MKLKPRLEHLVEIQMNFSWRETMGMGEKLVVKQPLRMSSDRDNWVVARSTKVV